jgi:uncharacterized Rmd1/YagE family protein
MSKEQRKRAGYKRIAAYCIAEGLRMKLLATFLKREHNVTPRVFDEAMYVVSLVFSPLASFISPWLIYNVFCRCTTFHYFLGTDLIPVSVLQQRMSRKPSLYRHGLLKLKRMVIRVHISSLSQIHRRLRMVT